MSTFFPVGNNFGSSENPSPIEYTAHGLRKTVWRYKGSLWEASMTQSGKKEIEDGSLMIVGMITVQDALNILRGVLKNPMHIN